MIDALRPYPEYRDSGVDAVGSVPHHWATGRLGTVGTFLKGSGGSKEDEVRDGVPCIRYGDLYTQHDFFIQRTRSFITPERAATYTPVVRGDVLFAGSGETFEDIGKSAVVLMDQPAVTGGDVLILRPRGQWVPEFLGYAAGSAHAVAQKAQMGRGVTVKHIYLGELKHLWLAVPPVEEQAAIVHFLDHADRQIRRYISAKEKLIKLLTEERQAIVDQAVRRGLDPQVDVRPSGLEWLGNIPAHWDVVRAKVLFSPRRGLALPDDVQLSATQAFGVIPQAEFETKAGRRVVKISMHLDKRRHVDKGDFVISMRSFQGGLERAWTSGAIRSSYIVLKPAPRADVEYFSYLFKSRGYIRALQATAHFIRDGQDLNFGNFCSVDLPLVPLAEQTAIAASIAGITANIDTAVVRTRSEIALIREFRTRLFADVVSGGTDVRVAAAELHDEIDITTRPDDVDGPDDEVIEVDQPEGQDDEAAE